MFVFFLQGTKKTLFVGEIVGLDSLCKWLNVGLWFVVGFPGLPVAIGLRDGMQRMVKWAKTVGQSIDLSRAGGLICVA